MTGRGLQQTLRGWCSVPPVLRRTPLWSMAGVLLLSLACDRMATVKRCKALVRDVNPKLDAIEKATRSRSAKSYAEASRLYGELARDLSRHLPPEDAGVSLDPRGFERSIREYQAMLLAASRNASSLSQALAAGNQASANIEIRQLEELSKSTKAAVKRIDKTCEPD